MLEVGGEGVVDGRDTEVAADVVSAWSGRE